jgi:hypothetical protein
MSFLGLSLLDWTAIAAIGTLALAAAATATIIVTVRMARGERTRDDRKRKEDRDWDTGRRNEDRERDDQIRREDRARDDELRRAQQLRDDELRREDRDESERRFRAEQRDREDYEARQVTVEMRAGGLPPSPGSNFSHRITVSTPVTYPVKQVSAQIAHQTNSGIGILPTGHGGDPAKTENGQTVYRIWAAVPEQAFQAAPIVRFTDRHGNLYYAYRQQTQRFPQNTDFIAAARQIDLWIRTGPKPDERDLGHR